MALVLSNKKYATLEEPSKFSLLTFPCFLHTAIQLSLVMINLIPGSRHIEHTTNSKWQIYRKAFSRAIMTHYWISMPLWLWFSPILAALARRYWASESRSERDSGYAAISPRAQHESNIGQHVDTRCLVEGVTNTNSQLVFAPLIESTAEVLPFREIQTQMMQVNDVHSQISWVNSSMMLVRETQNIHESPIRWLQRALIAGKQPMACLRCRNAWLKAIARLFTSKADHVLAKSITRHCRSLIAASYQSF